MKSSLSHTAWECKYHIVWIPKRRQSVLYGKLQKEIGLILGRLCRYKGVEVLEGTVQKDHVHACLSIPPKYAVSSIVGYLKGKSTMMIFEKYSNLRKNFRGHKFWARGYYVSTVGLDEGKVRKYIEDQKMNEQVDEDGRGETPFEGGQW